MIEDVVGRRLLMARLLAGTALGGAMLASATEEAEAANILFENTLFLSGATGATTKRTPAQRWSDIKNIKDFGAVGDGVTDDTAAIQAAVNWNTVTLTTNATTAIGNNVLHFASIPSTVAPGLCIASDITNPSALPSSTITGASPTTLTLGTNVTAPGIGSGDTIKFEQLARGMIFFPPGNYLVSAPITFSTGSDMSIIFQGVGASSRIFGSFPGYILDRYGGGTIGISGGGRFVNDLRIDNGDPAGGAIRMFGTITGGVNRCIINAVIGVDMSFCQSTSVDTCNFHTPSYLNSRAIIFAGNGIINAPDITGYQIAVNMVGIGGSLCGGRYEVNGIGVRLGLDAFDNSNTAINNFTIIGGSFESNGAHIYAAGGCGGGLIAGIEMQQFYTQRTGDPTDLTSARSVMPSYGIWAPNNRLQISTIESISVGGAPIVASIYFGDTDNRGNLVFNSVVSNNTSNTIPATHPTITIASPAIFTDADHAMVTNTPVVFSTTGALPTGLTAGTTYYVCNPTLNTYQVSLTPDQTTNGGSGPTPINTSGSQSGVHTRVIAGVSWRVPLTADSAEYNNCSVNPTYLFANLPTGANLRTSDKYFIRDANTSPAGTIGNTVTGGGVTAGFVVWNGSAWTLMSK